MPELAQVLSIIEPKAAVQIAADYPEPELAASSESFNAALWNTAAIVTVAVSSILVGVGIFTQFITPFSPLFFIILFGAPYAVGNISSQFMDYSHGHETTSYNYAQVHKKLQTFEKFNRIEMIHLLHKHGINSSALSADITSREFKILLAHFLLYAERIETVKNILANKTYPLDLSKSSSDDAVLHYYSNRAYLKEWGVFADKMRAACILERMYKPTKQILLSEVGQMTPKPFDKRCASERFMGYTSPYFVFKNPNHLSLKPADMDGFSIPQLHQRLFRV